MGEFAFDFVTFLSLRDVEISAPDPKNKSLKWMKHTKDIVLTSLAS